MKIDTETKRKLYIFFFAVLGLVMSLVVYGLGALIILNKNLNIDLNVYLTILVAAGAVTGYLEGKRWWRIIYVEKAYLKWTKSQKETKLLGLLVLIILTIAILFLVGNYSL